MARAELRALGILKLFGSSKVNFGAENKNRLPQMGQAAVAWQGRRERWALFNYSAVTERAKRKARPKSGRAANPFK
jgi:hypothetical protein